MASPPREVSQDDDAFFFSPRSTPRGSSESPHRPHQQPRQSITKSTLAERLLHATPSAENSPLRGGDAKGKGRPISYDSASSSTASLVAASTSRAEKMRAVEDDHGPSYYDPDAGELADEEIAERGRTDSRDWEGRPPTQLAGGSRRKQDDLRAPGRNSARGQGRLEDDGRNWSEYSTPGSDKSGSYLEDAGARPVSLAERKRAYWRSAGVNLLLILSWYFFSTLISVYNKWMFSTSHYKFSYPLFVTSFHMIIQFIVTGILMSCCGDRFLKRRPNGKRPRPSVRDWALKVAPCALATATDIGLSNLSLKTITLTFYTMCKSSNLAFVLFFAFLFGLEIIRWPLVGVIALITAGVVMMVAAETKFVLVGAVQVLTASAMGGLRWALTQLLLDRDELGLNHPVATVFWLAPIMAGGLAIASACFESWHAIFTGPFFHGALRSLRTIGLITLPGLLALCMNISEFALIQRTSVVTLSVAGIFKEVLTVILASAIFGDELTPINISGLCITLFGIGLYNWLRYRNLTSAASSAHGAVGGQRGSYAQVSDGIAHGDQAEVLFDEDHDGPGQSKTPSIAMSETRLTDADLSESEKERRRKREEEASMAGWETSGFTKTGNGFVDSDED